MRLKVFSVLLVVALLPLLFETTTGCKYNAPLPAASPNSYGCDCVCSPEPPRHRMQRVGAFEDDSEEQLNGNILLDSPDLDFLNGRFVGLKFRSVGIPANATIFSADVQFVAATASNAGTLTVEIAAELAVNGGSFSTTPGDLSGRTKTANPISWNLNGAWAAGSLQTTPNFADALQQVVNLPGFGPGNDIVLLFEGTAGTALRKAFSRDGDASLAALLTVEYEDPVNPDIGPLSFQVCMLPEDNANLNGGVTPDENDLALDCAGRVSTTVSGLANACGYPPLCNCDLKPDSQKFADKCDLDCEAEPVDADCSNFDPSGGMVTATNAGTDPAVCIANSPLSSAMFGQRTTCAVDGHAFITVEGELKIPAAVGTVKFIGEPCPGVGCEVGMEYNIDVDSITFGNFLKSATFSGLGSIGETTPGNEALLSPIGAGTFSPAAFDVSAQGQRGSDKRGLTTTNDDDVNVTLLWGDNPFRLCRVQGTLIGAVSPELKRCENAGPTANIECADDSECTDDPGCSDEVCNCEDVPDSSIEFALDVQGPILNHPPIADAGPDQQFECADAAVNDVVLDGSASSDFDDDIVLYSWLEGTRVGDEVGFDPVSKLEQSLGGETYILRVIDALGEADEDSVEVDVVDTMPPVVTCSVAPSVLNQTNHNLLDVGVAGTAVDACEGDAPITVNVFSDEDDQEDTGDGKHSPDAKDIALGTLRLRAERKGNGDGRVYLVVVEATDSSGNRGSSCCTVEVPHSNTKSAQTSVGVQADAARAFCMANNGTAPAGYFVVGDGPVIGSKQ